MWRRRLEALKTVIYEVSRSQLMKRIDVWVSMGRNPRDKHTYIRKQKKKIPTTFLFKSEPFNRRSPAGSGIIMDLS